MKTTDCKYNEGVRCPERKLYVTQFRCEPVVMCEHCGWNPAETAERLWKIREKLRRRYASTEL